MGEVLKERTERAKGDEELLSVTIANGVIRQIDSEKRNTASEDRSNYKIVKKGDVPYNSMRMWQGAVGNSKYNGIVSPAYTILTPTSEANGKFFMELFKKKSTLQIFQRWSQGLTSDTWNLKYPILSSIQFAIPSVEEQEKIAEYFSSLDYLITLHQRKYFIIYNKLITWEQRKLGDEAIEMMAGGDIDKEKVVEDGKYPIYANALTNDGIVGYYNDYFRVKAPAVTVTGRGEVGHAQARMTDFTPVVRLLAIRSNHDCYFLENAINNHKVIVESTGVPQLTVPQLASYNIFFPSKIEEEVKIGEYFNNLDNLITLHRRAL